MSGEIEKLELEALKNAKLTPFTTEFLQTISGCRIETYVVTMQSAVVVQKFVHAHGLACYFEEILTRDRFPSKRAQIAYILDRSAVDPSEILLVDDLKRNINECKDLGTKCFHFSRNQNVTRIKQMWNSIVALTAGYIR